MAPKRSRCPESLNEEEMAMCTQQLELLASFRDKKQRRIVASENGNPPQNPSKRLTVTGQELGQPEKQTGKSIFELGLPTLNPLEIRIQNGVGDFLEACSLCKKKLHGNDVFMYGNLGAFCSIQCRNHQIISDGYHVEYFCQSEDFLTPTMK